MKKYIFTLMLLALILVFNVNVSEAAEQKIAVVDVPRVVAQSQQVQALNKAQEAKVAELEKWIEVVKKDVEKQKTQEGKEKLFNKYKESYNVKKQELVANGQTQMQVIMNTVSETIAEQAKTKGYTMVITSNIVVYGGDDITEDVLKALNAKYTPPKKVIKK